MKKKRSKQVGNGSGEAVSPSQAGKAGASSSKSSFRSRRLFEEEVRKAVRTVQESTYVPPSTYRIQFNKSFTFQSAVEYISYLADLGIGALYCSPYFQAVPGSTHGYNVTDPNRINPEIGNQDHYNHFCSQLRNHGLEQFVDVVPNHMGVLCNNNRLWLDVLENGPASIYANFFDIEWKPVKTELANKLLVPILGDQFGIVLENKEIQLCYERGSFWIQYWEHQLPLAPKTYPMILEQGVESLGDTIAPDNLDYLEYLSVITAFHNLPPGTERREEKVHERYREKEIAKQRLDNLMQRSVPIRDFVYSRVELFNGDKEDPHSFDLLEKLLDGQHYRIASWRVAGEEINYRRFFDVNELAAIRVEDPEVFAYYHSLLFELLKDGRVRGLRIDHTDGLYDPPGYFCALQQSYLRLKLEAILQENYGPFSEADGDCIRKVTESPEFAEHRFLCIEIEKILERKESLPEDWLVHGTVGYDFLNALNGLFIMRHHEKQFDAIYRKFTAQETDFEDLLYEKKKYFARVQMSGEINTLAHRLQLIAEGNRRYRDFTLNNLTTAIRELIACFPVYRTYISPDAERVSERDEKYIRIAIEKAKRKNPGTARNAYDFIRDILLLQLEPQLRKEEQRLYRDFILRFQQLTSPIMAKGVEDTVFYVSNRFISLNEVGSDHAYFGYSRGEFHKHNLERNRTWPAAFITTSTHDTKRSEDVRYRLNVLSEIPEEWKKYINRWARINKKHKTLLEDRYWPDANTEYFIYQTLVGIWPDYPISNDYYPVFFERVWGYVEKSIREAKTHTNWTNPDQDYEQAVRNFVERILTKKKNYFLKIFLEFQTRIAGYGMHNSLSGLVLKIGSPGVCDFYQGTELWEYSLVDPDNRRPVDFDLRRHLLYRVRELMQAPGSMQEKAAELMREKKDSRIKVYVTWRGLNLRKRYQDIFVGGDYHPLEIEGEKSSHVVAFLRRQGEGFALVAAARFFTGLLENPEQTALGQSVWGDTVILLPPDLDWDCARDIFSDALVKPDATEEGAVLAVADLFRYFSFSVVTNRSFPLAQPPAANADDAGKDDDPQCKEKA